MAWKVEFDGAAEHDLDKLDPQVARRILSFCLNGLPRWTIRAALGKPSKAPNWEIYGSTGWGITG